MANVFKRFVKGILLKSETSDPSDNLEGSLWQNGTSNRLKAYIQSTVREIVTNSQSQTLTNKTIDADSNTINNIDNNEIKAAAAIDATKIADGSVSNTEFQYLDGVTSSIQTQLNGKQGNLVNSAGLAAALSDETGTGLAVFNNSPNIITPTGIVKGDVGLGNVDNTSDATKNSAVATLTNKTIDGDDNTVQDLALTSLKTNVTDANKFLVRNGSGVVVSNTKDVPSGTVVGTSDTQTLSAKTFSDAPLMKAGVDIEDPGAGTNKINLTAPTLSGNYTLKLPTSMGSNGQALTTNGTDTTSWSTIFTDPMTTIGDLIYRNGSNVTARLPVGTNGQVLTVSSGVPAWSAGGGGGSGGMESYSEETPSGTVNGSNVTFTVSGSPSAFRTYTKETPSGTVNGSNVTFTLANTPATSSLKLTVNGLKKRLTTDYTISGTTITFVIAPASGSTLYAEYGYDSLYVFYLYKNGILVEQGSGANFYTISGSTITFGTAPSTGSNLYCEYNTGTRERQETPSGTVNGSNTAFTTSLMPVGGNAMRVWLDGVLQRLTTDYSITTNTITFVTAPSTGQRVYCSYIY